MPYRRTRRRRHHDHELTTTGATTARPQRTSASPSTLQRQLELAHSTNRAQRQTALLQLQQQYGNAWVQRHLADGTLQREDDKKSEAKADSKSDTGFDPAQWVGGEIYDVLKKELGEEKLKEYAKQIAGKATEMLMAQVQGAEGEQDIIEKARMKEIAAALEKDLGQAVQSIFQSPQGKALKEALLKKTKQDPGFAIVMVLLGLAAAAAANADIPKFDQTFNLGKGFKAGGKADLGKFQAVVLKQVQASLGFTSEYFRANVAGSYTGEGENQGFAGQAGVAVGTSEVEFKSDFKIHQNGEFNVEAQNAFDFKKFGLTAGGSFSNIKGWKGIAELRLGEKTHYLSTRVNVGQDGKTGLQFDHKLIRDLVILSNSLKLEGNKTTLTNEAQLKDLFGAEGLNVTANLVTDLTQPAIQQLNLKADLKILGDPKDASKPTLFLRFDASYKAGPQGQKDEATGLLFLRGEF